VLLSARKRQYAVAHDWLCGRCAMLIYSARRNAASQNRHPPASAGSQICSWWPHSKPAILALFYIGTNRTVELKKASASEGGRL
jgi:hypothetical protein